MTITQDYTVKFAGIIKKLNVDVDFFTPFAGKKIKMPQRFLPSREFIEYHNKFIFIDA